MADCHITDNLPNSSNQDSKIGARAPDDKRLQVSYAWVLLTEAVGKGYPCKDLKSLAANHS